MILAFLAPCPTSGLVIYGSEDSIVPPEEVERAIEKIRTQKGMKVYGKLIEGANHFYSDHLEQAIEASEVYLDAALDERYCPYREPLLLE